MKRLFILMAIATTFLSACTDSTPNCADPRSVDLVKQIFWKTLGDQLAPYGKNQIDIDNLKKLVQVDVTSIVNAEHDESIAKYTCHASLVTRFPEREKRVFDFPLIRASLASMRDIQVSGSAIQTEIQYTSQVTADTKQHVVEVLGHKPIVSLVAQLSASNLIVEDKKPEVAPSSPASASVQPVQAPSPTDSSASKMPAAVVKQMLQKVVSDSGAAFFAAGQACGSGTPSAMSNASLGLPTPANMATDGATSVTVGGTLAEPIVTIALKPIGNVVNLGDTVVLTGSCTDTGLTWEVTGSVDPAYLPEP